MEYGSPDLSGNWILEIFQISIENGWCMKPFCSTCGASDFRSAVVRRAVAATGGNLPRHALQPGNPMLRDLSPSLRDLAIDEIINALSAIPDLRGEKVPIEGLRTLLIDLDQNHHGDEGDRSIDDMLAGTTVGKELTAMREHHANMETERRRREGFEHQARKLREERRKIHEARAALTGETSRSRSQRIEEGKSPIHKLLLEFQALSPTDRLVRISSPGFSFPLNVVPKDLIPLEADLNEISHEDRSRLIARIDRRKGRWAKLRKLLYQAQSPEDGN